MLQRKMNAKVLCREDCLLKIRSFEKRNIKICIWNPIKIVFLYCQKKKKKVGGIVSVHE